MFSFFGLLNLFRRSKKEEIQEPALPKKKKKYDRAYYRKHRAMVRRKQKKYYLKNREKIIAKTKAYYLKNHSRARKLAKANYRRHHARIRAAQKMYRERARARKAIERLLSVTNAPSQP